MATIKSLLVLCVMAGTVMANRERKMSEVLESLRRIEEHLSKEDRLWKITNITRIDFTVDKLNSKVERILSYLEGSNSVATGRSEIPSSYSGGDLEVNMEAIQSKLQNLEASVGNVEEAMKNLNFDPAKVNEIERRTTQLKDDMNTKLRKMMNVMTSLYEMSKDMKANSENAPADDTTPRAGQSSGGYPADFLVENLEEMERKFKEQLSVLSSEIRGEITSLKIMATSVQSGCRTEEEDPDEEWRTPQNNNARRNMGGRSSVGSTLDTLMESLGRSTREIREEIQSGMQVIDHKLQNLTVLSAQCDPLETSESVIRPMARRVEQSVEVKDTRRKGKSEGCTKIPQNVPNPKSCADLRKGGATCDGVYVIFPKGVRAVRVWCDMTTDGGGWTILMRRGDYGDKMTAFNRNWLSYKNGFGDVEGEFWLGNDVIHYVTTEESNALRVHLTAFDGDTIDLDYSSFSVANETANFRSSLGPAIGRPSIASNGFKYHGNRPFSTFDRKNDRSSTNCAAQYKGGWWFNGCYQGFLTGEYFREGERRDDSQGILWYDWKKNEALKEAQMMVRPRDFEVRN